MATSSIALEDYINIASTYRWANVLRAFAPGDILYKGDPVIVANRTIKDSPLLCRTVDTLYKPQ